MDKALTEPSVTLGFKHPKNIELATGYVLETCIQKVGKFHISEESSPIVSRHMYE